MPGQLVTPRKNKLRFGNALGHETSAFCEMQSEPKVLSEGKHAPPVQAWLEAAPPQVSRVVVQVLGVMVWEPFGVQVADSCAERQSSCVGGESHDPTGRKGPLVLPDPMKQFTLLTTQPQPQLAAGAFKPRLTLPRGVV